MPEPADNGGRSAYRVDVTTRNISRLDVTLDDRPIETQDIVADHATVHLSPPTSLPASGKSVVELRCFEGDRLVAARREWLVW
jgi:hypothetical protein